MGPEPRKLPIKWKSLEMPAFSHILINEIMISSVNSESLKWKMKACPLMNGNTTGRLHSFPIVFYWNSMNTEFLKTHSIFVTARKTFPEGIVFGFSICFFYVCMRSIFRTAWQISTKFSHKVEGWTHSYPIEIGRCWFNRLAANLEKHCFPVPGGLILASSSYFIVSSPFLLSPKDKWILTTNYYIY